MQLGMIGLGRMGANMVRRLMRGKHECVVYDVFPDAAKDLAKEGAIAAATLDEFVQRLKQPRAVWMMVPAGVVDKTIESIAAKLSPGDILIDGGNSCYIDDIRRAKDLKAKGIHYVDCGTSGGVWGLERGYCQMIGGEGDVGQHLDLVFSAPAPCLNSAPRTPGRAKMEGTAEQGGLRCVPNGAAHLVHV